MNILKKYAALIYAVALVLLTLLAMDVPRLALFANRFTQETLLDIRYYSLSEVDTSIAIVNIDPFPEDTIRTWLRRIMECRPGPKVVIVDNFSDSLTSKERVPATIILPAIREFDYEPFRYALNNYSTNEVYGFASIESYYRYRKFAEDGRSKLPSLAMRALELFDKDRFTEAASDENGVVVDMLKVNHFYVIDAMHTYEQDYLSRLLADKIVIMGRLGHAPDFTPGYGEYDNVHDTPIGLVYGPTVLASQIHSLLNPRIRELNQFTSIAISVIIFCICFVVILKFKMKRAWLHIVVWNVAMIVLLVSILVLAFFILDRHLVLIDIGQFSVAILLAFQLAIIYRLFVITTEK